VLALVLLLIGINFHDLKMLTDEQLKTLCSIAEAATVRSVYAMMKYPFPHDDAPPLTEVDLR
jgi:hypothetical protein